MKMPIKGPMAGQTLMRERTRSERGSNAENRLLNPRAFAMSVPVLPAAPALKDFMSAAKTPKLHAPSGKTGPERAGL